MKGCNFTELVTTPDMANDLVKEEVVKCSNFETCLIRNSGNLLRANQRPFTSDEPQHCLLQPVSS